MKMLAKGVLDGPESMRKEELALLHQRRRLRGRAKGHLQRMRTARGNCMGRNVVYSLFLSFLFSIQFFLERMFINREGKNTLCLIVTVFCAALKAVVVGVLVGVG